MYIYGYQNKINQKWYIGKSECKNKTRRHNEHVKHVRNNMKTQFYDAVRKYGWEMFNRHILFECDSRIELNQKEIELIAEYDSYRKGYNATQGGDGGDTFSSLSESQKIETNKKRSVSLKEAWVRDREKWMKSFSQTDYSYRRTKEYRKSQSERCKTIKKVIDPAGNVYEFKGLEEMKMYFKDVVNKDIPMRNPHRVSPTQIAWRGESKGWKLID